MLPLLALLLACGEPAAQPDLLPVAPQAVAEGPARWQGVPLERLPALGLGEPTLDAVDDAWQAPLEVEGAWVRLTRFPSDAAAEAAFPRHASMAWNGPLEPVEVEGADQALGADGVVIARSHNAVLQVRGPDGSTVAASVLAELRPAE